MKSKEDKRQFYRDVGWQIRSIRQSRGVSLQALAERLGKSYQTVQKYEDGSIAAPADVLKVCSRIFKVPVGYFYGEVETANISVADRNLFKIAGELSKLPKELREKTYGLIVAVHKTCADIEGTEQEECVNNKAA